MRPSCLCSCASTNTLFIFIIRDLDRYTKLLRLVDLKKDFVFSYSYPIMYSLQMNLCQKETEEFYEGKMFVWNEYLTRQIRHYLKNTLWTVALVHGYFKQVH